jgi:hypothetical protein
MKVLLRFFGEDAVVERIDSHGRPCTSIGRVKFNSYLKARAEGTIPGYPKRVKNQTVLNEVRFVRSVFNPFATLQRVYDLVDLPEQRAAVAFLNGDVDRLPVSHRELERFRKAA